MFSIYRCLSPRRFVNWLPGLLAVTLISISTLAPVLAQTRPGLISFHRIEIPDDVPAHLSSAMVQDAQGLIWIGTQDGLVRYDGYSYKVYQQKSNDATSLGGSYIRSLFVARDGRLWVGSISDGVSVFDPHTEKFTRYRHDAAHSNSLANDRVEAITQDRDGRFWLATDNGLDRFDPASGRFEHFQHNDANPASLDSNQVRALLIDHAGQLWVGTRNGLQRRPGGYKGTGGFTKIDTDAHDGDSLYGQNISNLFEDTRNQIWIGTADEGAAVLEANSSRLHRLRPARSQSDTDGLSHYWVHSIAQVGKNEIWIGTFGGGIDVVDPVTFKLIDHLRHDSALTSTIGSDRVGTLLVDKSGLVWAGTWGGGMAWHDPSARAFIQWRHSPNNPDGPTQTAIVRSMETANGKIWLGTDGNGIDVMDSDGHLRGGFRPNPGDPGALQDGSITCMAQAPDGTIWVATLDGTLHRMRSGQNEFERFRPREGLPGGPIRAMAFDADGSLWAGSLNGLAHIASDDSIRAFVHRDNDSSSLSGREVESLAFTPDGTLWVGTENGVNAFNTQTGKAVRILRDPQRADSLPDNWVPDMMVAKNGRLWLATQAGVAILDKWDGRQAHFDVLSTRLHLPGYPADTLIQDAQGKVWLGSRICIDPVTWQYRSFGPADGNEFRTTYIASRVRTSRGELLFGSPEGLLMLRPELLRTWSYQPPVIVSMVSIDDSELAGATTLKQLALNAEQRNVRLEFAALDFSAPQKLRYRYRLDGFDNDWVTVNAEERVAIYTGLPPGNYQLRIQGSNRSGAWSPAELRLPLTVAPAYYQTWWFRIALASLVLLAIAAASQLRVRQLRLRSIALERAVAERTADLQSAYQQIEEASLTDSLTQLNNRRFLEKTIQSEFELAARQHSGGHAPSNSDLVLFMLDLDYFKLVNDEYGHAAGDAVLVQTAHLLKLCMRASDYVIRWGGEEFLLVARFIDRTQAPALAEKIRSAIEAHPYTLPDSRIIHKTVSIGFATFPFVAGHPGAMKLDTLQRIADRALYAAKRSWRNAWVGVVAVNTAFAVAQKEGAIAEPNEDQKIAQFLNDPEWAVVEGLVEVITMPDKTGELRW